MLGQSVTPNVPASSSEKENSGDVKELLPDGSVVQIYRRHEAGSFLWRVHCAIMALSLWEGRNILNYDGWAGSDIIPAGDGWAEVVGYYVDGCTKVDVYQIDGYAKGTCYHIHGWAQMYIILDGWAKGVI
ncbi:hypothetical protein EDB19DRAFT_1836057 [Suillus lakei]|nr:hypothetical protein EDB19DRAFT_1836057 [Suillus lakei]